jgi:hypothetical protein
MDQPSKNPPEGPRRKSRLRWFILLLPIGYLLSFGPILALADRIGNAPLRRLAAGFYVPIMWLEHTPLKEPLEDYYFFCGGQAHGD